MNIPYEKPRLIVLKDVSLGASNCVPGSSPIDVCGTGHAAANACNTGTGAHPFCATGHGFH